MISDYVRKLAKSYKYQVLFNRAQDIGGIELFRNKSEFSYLQILFLHWLNTYNSLFLDLARKEEFIDEEVINDPIRTDAYLIYRNIKQKEKVSDKDYDKKSKERAPAPGIPKLIFTPKKDK